MKKNVILCSLILVLCSLFLASCINPFYPFQKINPNEPTEPGDPDCYNCGECEICDPVTDCNDCGVCEICDPVDPDFIFIVSNEAEWNEARAVIAAGGNDKSYIINITGSFNLPGDVFSYYTFGNVTGITVLISGAYTITLNSAGFFLSIDSGQTVIIRDLAIKGFSSNFQSVVYIHGRYVSKAEFVMEGNASISGNYLGNTDGGGVFVHDGPASFTMRDNARIYDNSAIYGGGVVVAKGTTFIMQDNARIHNNSAEYGGGVYLGNFPWFTQVGVASFTMQGNSSVDLNHATATNSGAGGGVYVDSGDTFIRSGNASVTNNSSAGTGHNIGPYEIGDTGPGGGKIFYADYVGFTVHGTGSGNTGVWPDSYRAHYLEAAPNNWVTTPDGLDPLFNWALTTSPVFTNVDGTSTEIGTGRRNTALIIAATGGNPGDVPAANECNNYQGPNNTNDWFLPSKIELNELCLSKVIATIDNRNYFTWSSSQVQNETGRIWITELHLNYLDRMSTNKTGTFRVRPIRAF